ncbi:MAG: twin-arginine translocase TatA/TatE family subunit [Spirochaetales bacterium]|nr:twin-arginine translocase TatA/TatE family subunit [Leptospiraceae bacterium]MCP5480910.1 twin-arginine translocase TatA/TatE family subunit [Spirochaetales bacterium]MCP5485290.1 twin-arginine translocase TatA/TatE family subunit [Spirochaetales bacterium]
MSFTPGIGEILVILVLVLVLFGGRKIPQLAKDLGSGIREFKKSLSGESAEIQSPAEPEESVASTRPRRRKAAATRTRRS